MNDNINYFPRGNSHQIVKANGGNYMKSHVVIGFDARDHIVIGKVFEDLSAANEYHHYLNTEMIGKVIGTKNRQLDYADLFEMDYVPIK